MPLAKAKHLLARAKLSHRARHDRDAIGHLIEILDELLKGVDLQEPHLDTRMRSEVSEASAHREKSINGRLS
jgi:hypothetical protein